MEQKRLKEFGPWSEQISSSGKRYYYNRETEVSQWEKPPEWREYERALADNSNTPTTSINQSQSRPSVATHQSSIENSAKRIERDDRKRKAKSEISPNQDQKPSTAKTSRQDQPEKKPNDDEFRKYAKYARPELISHLKGWKGDFYNNESKKILQNVGVMNEQIRAIDMDIKTVRSLVYIAETKSTLLKLKHQFITKQLENLESSIINFPSNNS